MSHGHEFVVRKPYMYPLFKLHKLDETKILNKVIPPTRMVTSGVGGPTYRLGTFLDNLLKPVVQAYCKDELVKDSTHFIRELMSLEAEGITKKMNFIGTLDVDALYPSIKPSIAISALNDALHSATSFSEETIDMILAMAKICIENSVICYRGVWYKTLKGIPTGGPESGSIANIVVYFVLEKILLVHPKVTPLNKLSSRKRFLDDLWFGWMGTQRQFDVFKAMLNKIGGREEINITFKGEVGKSVDFLDTTITLKPSGHICTSLYVKPTDATRYLHRRSDHSTHTFRSIPFSQLRRAVVLCSEESDKLQRMDYISEKLLNSGYKPQEVTDAMNKALELNRSDILQQVDNHQNQTGKALTFTINRDGFMSSKIREIIRESQEDIDLLLGEPTRIILAERRNPNTASLLFAKSSFSRLEIAEKDTQKCGNGHGCMTCDLLDLPKEFDVWENNEKRKRRIKLDFRQNCTTENAIYIYVCRHCEDPSSNFYIGQTVNTCRIRANGHRACFNQKHFKKSALSTHTYADHREHSEVKLNNFSLGIIKQTSAANLDRLEDFYVEHTNAELSLNRYKVTS